MPTLSAAAKAIEKFCLLSFEPCRLSKGTRSGKYEWKSAQKASPSFQDELKLVISTFRYPISLFWHHLSSAFRFDPPFTTSEFSGSFRSPGEREEKREFVN